MVKNGSEILIDALVEQGVDTIFGYPGGAVLNIYDALYKNSDRIHHILTAHEQGAAHAADGTTVIPVSKVSFGFGTGGTDFASKHAQPGAPLAFGGGAGVTVSPVCFLIITKDGGASILGINAQADSTVDRLVEMIPGAINRVSSFVEGFSGKKKAPADESAPMEGGEE